MLIAPRISQSNATCSFKADDESSTVYGPASNSFEKGLRIPTLYPESAVRQAWPSLGNATSPAEHEITLGCNPQSRISNLFSVTMRSLEALRPVTREYGSFQSSANNIQGNLGGSPVLECGLIKQNRPADDQKPSRWDEAIQRLNALRERISPPPISTVKRRTLNPEHQIQPPATTLRHSIYSDLESISDIGPSNSLTKIERLRAAALAKLEGRSGSWRYTSDSIYSRNIDGTPFQIHEDHKARPQWKNFGMLWPD